MVVINTGQGLFTRTGDQQTASALQDVSGGFLSRKFLNNAADSEKCIYPVNSLLPISELFEEILNRRSVQSQASDQSCLPGADARPDRSLAAITWHGHALQHFY